MEARGFVRRETMGHDRRKIRVRLTESGRDLQHSLGVHPAELNRLAMQGFSDGEIGFIRLALKKMQDNLLQLGDSKS